MKYTIGIIYIIEALKGKSIGKIYVGQSKSSLDNRKKEHLYELGKHKHKNLKLQNYYNKYGKNSLNFKVLVNCPINELNFWEKWWIKCFDAKCNGFNATNGGDTSESFSKEITLKNTQTGELVTYPSHSSFCENNKNIGMGGINKLLKRKKECINNIWTLPESCIEYKCFKVIDPMGKVLVGSSKFDISIKYNINNDFLNMVFNCLYKRKYNHYLGWRKYSDKIVGIPHKFELYSFISPIGELFKTNCLKELCTKFNLKQSNMSHVWSGDRPTCKGWRKA